MQLRDAHGPLAASTFAGVFGAGVVDAAVTLARGGVPGAGLGVVALALGLYGVAALVLAVVVGLFVGGVLAAIPGGAGALRADPERDAAAATGLLAGALGVGVAAVVNAAGQRLLIGQMQSQKLATIAAAGMVAIAAVPAAVVALAALPALGRLARALPRPRATGRAGLLLMAFVAAAALGLVFALSRADWRVLDLGPLVALAIALGLGAAHGIFWYGSAAGRRLHARLPTTLIKIGAVVVVLAALFAGARVPEGAPAYQAVSDGALGLRFALALARKATDHDGDGFSARFGGGDCDDHDATIYPGADDIPGDGIDQNCEGGDAKIVADAPDAPSAEAPRGAVAPPRPAGPAFWKGNILIVTIDAFRGDRLGVAGYRRPAGPDGKSLTPTIDALAARGAYFPRAWSQAPNTPRSFPSILTSRTPSGIAWDKPGVNYPNLLPSNRTFFEGLAGAGLTPIGIFSHFYFTADRGISKSFSEWSNDGAGTIAESNKDVASPRIVPRVIARLTQAAARKERFVLWTHLFEPHSSYMPHKEFPTTLTGVPGLMEKYDYEIAFADLWLGKLLDAVKRLGLADDTVVVVMADHGEAWGEHKAYFHGSDLFDEQLRVPLVIAVPGQRPHVFPDEVALVDVGPTLLDMVGVAPFPTMRGHSLLPLLEGKPRAPHPIFSEMLPATAWPHHAVMMVDGAYKLIHRVSDRRWELYDLGADPTEQHNLADAPARRAVFESLRAKLVAFEEQPK
ncbi:MAG TPA: sulfatase-like hydrolase/transferase [Polyangia bacterium]|nr:sulfatase-like hydrolase/transferase [Polyangia bacterium]